MTRDDILAMKPGRELDARAKVCIQCGKLIIRGKKESNRDWFGRRFCSNSCSTKYRNLRKGKNPRNWVTLTCEYCQREFQARKIYYERGQYKFCSNECASLANRKHDVREFNGKKYYFSALHGYYSSLDGSKMHRDVWEYFNGPIPEGYVVHHKDGNKTNNAIENLELMEWGSHTRYHHKTGVSVGVVICKECGTAVIRKLSEIKKGQNKFCSRSCSNAYRRRVSDGTIDERNDFKRTSRKTS